MRIGTNRGRPLNAPALPGRALNWLGQNVNSRRCRSNSQAIIGPLSLLSKHVCHLAAEEPRYRVEKRSFAKTV
jgi:hypothetical protein